MNELHSYQAPGKLMKTQQTEKPKKKKRRATKRTVNGEPVTSKRKKVKKKKGSRFSPPKVRGPNYDSSPLSSPENEEDKGKAFVAPRKKVSTRNITSTHRSRGEKYRYESATIRDISNVPEFSGMKLIDFSGINWERRMACKADPVLDLLTYMPKVFSLPFGDFHKQLINEIEQKITEGGRKIIACPRRSGKTAICRGMIIRSMKFGLRQFSFFVGSKEPKAIQTLEFVKGYWYRNKLLQQDFPEFSYPIYRCEGRAGQGIQGQLYKGERTHLNWKSDEVQLPCLMLDKNDVQGHLEHDPDSLIYLEEYDRYIVKGSGGLVRVSGIDGSIRGEADLHPILLTQPRPDLVLLDDIIRDQKADSPKSCEDLERLIEASIDYLAAPGISQAILWPGTVIREGDPTDNYLDHNRHPEWAGKRVSLIAEYPEGIDNFSITEETEQGKLWLQYAEVRKESYRQCENLKLANKFYKEHREVMEEGFVVVWESMYVQDSRNPDENEISAIQSAMNMRFKDHIAFLSELQNKPNPRVEQSSILLSSGEVAEKTTGIPRNELSAQWTNIVGFIDVQDEILFYTLFAHDHAFNGQFIDYGTFPEVTTRYFKKNQTGGWSLLTKLYYQTYEREKPPAGKLTRNRNTKVRAPFEPKIYHALKECTESLLSREFVVHDQHSSIKKIKGIAIDTQWGKPSETIKRFVRESNDPRLICYHGAPFLPSHRQLEEYESKPGCLLEHEQHPNVRESTWQLKPNASDGTHYLYVDVNRLKNFLMKRLATPIGSPGCVTLYQDLPANHAMFADHLTRSQYPEPIQARGMKKDCWQPRPGSKDEDDLLDCSVGCMCMASVCGASLKTTEGVNELPYRNIREIYEAKKKRRIAQ